MRPQDDWLKRMVKILCAKDPQFAKTLEQLNEAFKKKDLNILKDLERKLIKSNNECWEEVMRTLAKTTDSIAEKDLVMMATEMTQMRNRVIAMVKEIELKGFDYVENKGIS